MITTLIVAALAVALSIPLASNAVLLLMEHSNVIPGESSIFTFEPCAMPRPGDAR